ncbi:TldD/PmbA family protein [Cohaesibacter celericrescens]|uniref:Modulator protein n=1 Tax=Cohaesibacter celericrescens TaxID=2067669 RepID=A0A2N5XKL1_9HYPH|nr:TldD/PmbA family protein [Cohaesibacter celericrescens]PLW75042.1 modulator protein [Cohaesibacter celericrescens]
MSDLLDQSIILDRAQHLVDAAIRAGADSADAIAALAVSSSVGFRQGALEENEHSENDSMALRVFIDGCKASVSTNTTSDKDILSKLAERAVAMARMSPNDPFARLAAREDLMDRAVIEDRLVALDPVDMVIPTTQELSELALSSEEAALAVQGVTKSAGASAGHYLGGMVLATSHGFVGSYMSSRISFSTSAIAGEGSGMERDYSFSAAVHRADLKPPSHVGLRAGERAVARLNPIKVETGTYDVIFEPRVSSSLLGHFASAINGSAIARHTSFLMDKLGRQIFPAGIYISDDPTLLRGLGSRPFDGEGVDCQPLSLVENGYLNQWVLDSATAAELGLKSNGRAARAGANPFPATTNLTLQAGTHSQQDLISGVKDGVYVTDLIGHGVNGVTGDYSRGASGFRIKDGKLAEAISEITIAGNLIDMFARVIPANDLRFEHSVNAPSILIEGMTVAGR